MQAILSIAIAVTLTTSLVLVLLWRKLRVSGEMPSSLFAFLAILFTSGLDVGLIMFPLTEFPVYAAEAPYQFANPLAIEFGFWGFLVWMFYFLTTFYFCAIEPRLKTADRPADHRTVEVERNYFLNNQTPEIPIFKDQGGGFDAAKVPETVSQDAEMGRGLALMRALVDNVAFRNEPQAGAVVHMVKNLNYLADHPLRRNGD
mgnify:CR=1 FL=1